jgi:DNA ligase 1
MREDSLQRFAAAAEALARTTKKLEKTAIVADFFKSSKQDEAAISAVFLCGRPFPLGEETTLQIGGRSLWQIVAELSGKDEGEITAKYRQHGDLGAVAEAVLPEVTPQLLGVTDLEGKFRDMAAARGSLAKTAIARQVLSGVQPLAAKYVIKIMTGDLRIGLKESLVEEAIAKAYGATLTEVQRANMLLGDVGEALKLAAQGRLGEAKMRLFHPLGFMLASPIESAEEGLSYFADPAVEDKYDGIRAQAHISSEGEVRIFSRTRDEITESFPELAPELAGIAQDAILDGEIVAWEYPDTVRDANTIVDEPISQAAETKATNVGRARPFTALQQRLGRKKVSDKMLRETPVAFLAFDILYANGALTIDLPLRERAAILDALLEAPRRPVRVALALRNASLQPALVFADAIDRERPGRVALIRAPAFRAAGPAELEQLFTAAQERGNEGLMIKNLASSYTPGKRGKSWLKMKRELATLDVVVTAVEYGHGKRIGMLSDYTFAVWDEDQLVNIGKAYSGLTDAEIAEMTEWFLEHTIEDQGFRRIVEPQIVLEVAFNNMMKSDRHESGYALRFPRIVRLRPDKLPQDADTITRAREIYQKQQP